MTHRCQQITLASDSLSLKITYQIILKIQGKDFPGMLISRFYCGLRPDLSVLDGGNHIVCPAEDVLGLARYYKLKNS